MNWKILHVDETDSTNQAVRERDVETVVVADYQTAGRGCGTNTWESARGANLLFSVLLHPVSVPAADQFILSMANALALHDALAAYIDDVSIKWPNDIYWHDRKLSGTLIETTLQGRHIGDCIVGNGVNVNQQSFLSDAPNPVSLRQILGRDVDREELFQQILGHLSKYMEMVDTGNWSIIRNRYRSFLYRLSERHLYRFADGSELFCRLVNVADDGRLELLDDHRELHSLAFKEVQFVIDA